MDDWSAFEQSGDGRSLVVESKVALEGEDEEVRKKEEETHGPGQHGRPPLSCDSNPTL